MSTAVKEIIKKAKALKGKERGELLKELPRILSGHQKLLHFRDQEITMLARLANKHEGVMLPSISQARKFLRNL